MIAALRMTAVLAEQVAATLAKASFGDVSYADLTSAINSTLSTGLCPEELYALLCFVRHERRQQWVGYLVESRLRGQGKELAQLGAIAHPEGLSQDGDVPGEPGWRYFFHGCGCCFTHCDGTSIDVDFADDGTALEIDPYFYTQFLQSLPAPEWCERQLKQPAEFENAWQFDLVRLTTLGLIQRQWRFRLTDDGRSLGELIEPVVELLDLVSPLNRCWLLCLLGDYANASNCASATGIAVSFDDALQRQAEARAKLLKSALRGTDESQARFACAALGLMGPERCLTEMQAAISRKPATGLNHAALAVLKRWNIAKVTDCLTSTLSLMTERSVWDKIRSAISGTGSMESERPRLGLAVGIAEELIRRFQPADIPNDLRHLLIAALRADCFAMEDDAGFLLFLLEPEQGLPKLAKSLSSRVPITRTGAACFLALIGNDSCVDILTRAAKASPEHGGHEAACALSLMLDDRAQSTAREWLHRHDGYEEAEGKEIEVMGRTIRTWSMEEIMRSHLREDMRHSFERAQLRFGQLFSQWRPNQ